MEVVSQRLVDILDGLRALTVDWQDEVALRVIDRVRGMPVKSVYTEDDVRALLDEGTFDDGLLIARLFLGLSKDNFTSALMGALGAPAAGQQGYGVLRYRADPAAFFSALSNLGLLEAMASETSRPLHWTDTLVERLRSGRGSAITGQVRGRGVENFAEEKIRAVFGDAYEPRVTFTGRQGKTAKCDFAIPSRDTPRIVIEAKGYGATGSKMTDIIGDIRAIIDAKRSDTAFLFVTDGVTWRQRASDLKKILEHQNQGDIARIYTLAMAERFEADLRQLRAEFGL